MSLSLVRIFSSPHLSTSSLLPIPPSSPSHLPPQLPNPHFVFCRYRRRDASIRGGLFKVYSFSTFGVHGGVEFDSGSEEEQEEDDEQIRASYYGDELEEEEGTISAFVLLKRWDVLGLGQAMEIAKGSLTRVPERYVRPHHERPIIISTTTPLPQLPIIDLTKLLSQDLNLKGPELEKLHSACKEWGFFQLINHGVSTSLLENVKMGAHEFFNLPIEEKKKFGQKEGDVEGYGQAFVISEEQKLEWADMFFMLTLPPHLRKPHLFPSLPLPFRDHLETYSTELKNLAIQMVDLMANALTVDTKENRELFGERVQSMRMNYYPPCPQPDLVMGLNPHSDGGGLTILLQANEVEGLQIKKDGLWIPVKPLPNAFIINIGDMLEMMTNGIYRSNEHRAIVNSEKERLSIATFCNPGTDVILRPAPSLVTPKTPAVFKTISVPEYYRGYLARELSGKSYLDSLRIQNEDDKSS